MYNIDVKVDKILSQNSSLTQSCMFNFQKLSLTLNWKLSDVKDNQKEEINFLTGVKNNINKTENDLENRCVVGTFVASKF